MLRSIAVLWGLAIVFLSLYPFQIEQNATRLWEHSDKVMHLVMYAALALLFLFDFKPAHLSEKVNVNLVLWLVLFGIIIEVIQEFMDLGRYFDFLDILANTSGVMIALTGYFIFKKLGWFKVG